MIDRILKPGFIKTAALFLLLTAVITAPLKAEEEIAVLTRVERNVEIRRAGEEEWIRAELGDYLSSGDRVRAARRSSAEISFLAGVETILEENTEIEIRESATREDTDIEMVRGEVFNKVRGITNVEIRTPQAVAAVRGTQFGVELDQHTRVYVLEGRVDVFNPEGRVELTEGTETTVEPGKAPSDPGALDEETRRRRTEEIQPHQLRLEALDEAVAGQAVRIRLTALDEEGNIVDDARDRVEINSGRDIYLTERLDPARWNSMPRRVRLENGLAEFYLRTYDEGPRVISASSSDLATAVLEMNFTLPDEKELLLDLGGEYRMRLEFRKR